MTIYQSQKRNNDPKPWVNLIVGTRWSEQVADHVEQSRMLRPRPEYDLPVNPILAFLREDRDENDFINHADAYKYWLNIGIHDFSTATSEHFDHARRVLSKLAAVYS